MRKFLVRIVACLLIPCLALSPVEGLAAGGNPDLWRAPRVLKLTPDARKTASATDSPAFADQALILRLAASDWFHRHSGEDIYARGRFYRLYQNLRYSWSQRKSSWLAMLDEGSPGLFHLPQPALESGNSGRSPRIEGDNHRPGTMFSQASHEGGGAQAGAFVPTNEDVDHLRDTIYQPILAMSVDDVAPDEEETEMERAAEKEKLEGLRKRMFDLVDPLISAFARTAFVSPQEKEAVCDLIILYIRSRLDEYLDEWRECSPKKRGNRISRTTSSPHSL